MSGNYLYQGNSANQLNRLKCQQHHGTKRHPALRPKDFKNKRLGYEFGADFGGGGGQYLSY